MSTEKRIRDDYPSLAWMLDIGELKPLMLDAFGEGKPFDKNKFDAKLWQTNWWKTRGTSARDWQRLKNMDPRQAQIQLGQGAMKLVRLLGIDSKYAYGLAGIVEAGVVNDWDEQTLLGYAMGQIQAGKVKGLKGVVSKDTGTVGAAYRRIKEMSRDYMTPMSQEKMLRYAKNMVSGLTQWEQMDNYLSRHAKAKWPHLADSIDAGVTPGEFFQGHQQAIGELLEYGNPEQVNLLDKKWKRVTSFNDGGTIRPMTVAETEKFVRGTQEWGETRNAAEEAAGMAETIATKFGAVA